jgi:iron complex outermembrane receptor protein
VRATLPGRLAGLPNRFTMGVDLQRQHDVRKNWANCNGVTTVSEDCPELPAEKGALTLNQAEIVSSIGPYARDELSLSDKFEVDVGLRWDWVHFTLQDALIDPNNPDDSGERALDALSPMVGLLWRLTPLQSLYGNISTAFETPTTTELTNKPDGSAGINQDLQPQRSVTYEVGTKGFAGRFQYDLAVFDIEVQDELIPFDAGNGRTYFRNAGRTRRNGVELAVATTVGAVDLAMSYTWSHFRFREYTLDGTSFAGNTIPGIPEQQLQGSATWHIRNAFVVVEGLGKSKVFVDDQNSAAAPGFGVMNVRVGGTALLGRPWLSPVLSVANVFGTSYVGSVAINATGGKYYEPAPTRVWTLGLTVAYGH